MDVRIDLHCHSSASYDSEVSPRDLLRRAVEGGLTHVAITDHDRVDGALALRRTAPKGLAIIVGQEIRSEAGDVLGLFLEQPIPSGLPLHATITAIRAQGGPRQLRRHPGLASADAPPGRPDPAPHAHPDPGAIAVADAVRMGALPHLGGTGGHPRHL